MPNTDLQLFPSSPSIPTYVERTYNLAVNPVVLPDSLCQDEFLTNVVLYVTLTIVHVSLLQNSRRIARGKLIARGRIV